MYDMEINYTKDFGTKKQLITFKQIIIVLLSCMLLVTIQYGYNDFSTILTQIRYNKYLSNLETQKNVNGLESLKQTNSDILAWLTINDVNLSVPIVKTNSSQDEDFYLTHGFDKKQNSLGCPYQKYDCDFDNNNTLFVGHSSYTMTVFGHKTSESIFGKLNTYTNTTSNFDYLVKLETFNGTKNYKIIGCFFYNVTNTSSPTYQEVTNNIYANNISSTSSYNNFINTLKMYNLLDNNFKSSYLDHFITLFTCYYNLDFRTIVVAKEIQ